MSWQKPHSAHWSQTVALTLFGIDGKCLVISYHLRLSRWGLFNQLSLPCRKVILGVTRTLWFLHSVSYFVILTFFLSFPHVLLIICYCGEPQGRDPQGSRTERLLVSHEPQMRLQQTLNSFNTVYVGHRKQELILIPCGLRSFCRCLPSCSVCVRKPQTRAWLCLSQLTLSVSQRVLFGLVLPV